MSRVVTRIVISQLRNRSLPGQGQTRQFSQQGNVFSKQTVQRSFGVIGGAGVIFVGYLAYSKRHVLSAKVENVDVEEMGPTISLERELKPGEKRFRNFASLEYNGEPIMTMRDFLDSIIQDRPRPRIKSRVRCKTN